MNELVCFATAVVVGLALAACGGGGDLTATPTTTTTADPGTTPRTGSFALTSSAFVEGGTYATTYTCDGAKSTPSRRRRWRGPTRPPAPKPSCC